MDNQKTRKAIIISAAIAGLGFASGSVAWGKSSSNLAPCNQANSLQVLVSKSNSAAAGFNGSHKTCKNCIPYVIKNKSGIIFSDHQRDSLAGKESLFEDGKLLIAVSKPNFKISLQPDGIQSGVYAVVEFPANSVALIEQVPNGMFRVANLLGTALQVKIRTNGQHETLPVLSGEELTLAPEYVNDSLLIPTDGVEREPVQCGNFIAGCKASKYKFDASQMVRTEKLFACDQTFTPGTGLLRFAKRELLAKEKSFRNLTPIAHAE